MSFVHAGKNYKKDISKFPLDELKTLKITDDYLLPCNPIVSSKDKDVKIAFFGLNAHCSEKDYKDAMVERNFIEWCQDNGYLNRLFGRIDFYTNKINKEYFDDGATYYSNIFKIVLRKKFTTNAKDAISLIGKCETINNKFVEMLVDEVNSLKKKGCKVFIVFGHEGYSIIPDEIKNDPEIIVKREYHFSRFTHDYSGTLVKEINKELKKII